jgi:hypothetical protein
MALLMAAVGIYGVISYTIGRRTSEIGLRMALGTSQTGVLRMVLRETVVEGIAIGLPCAIAAAPGQHAGGRIPSRFAGPYARRVIVGTDFAGRFVPAPVRARIPCKGLRCG